jgi:myosin heavy chain 6/7
LFSPRYILKIAELALSNNHSLTLFQEAFDILGFSDEEKKSCYKCTASILHMGEMQFKERGEQAEPEGTAEAEKVSFLLGVNSNDFIKCLIKPKIKVGTEVVTQGRNKAQVSGIIVI